MSLIGMIAEAVLTWKSLRWVQWKTNVDERTCQECIDNNGKIIAVTELGEYQWPMHLRCRCIITIVEVIKAGQATQDGKNGADYYIAHKGTLPNNYVTEEEARNLGWKNKQGNLNEVAPGKLIGGDIYYNGNGKLPKKIRTYLV